MFNNNKILAVIPAMSGEEKIPRKNTRLLGEKPLIAHTIDTLKESEYVDDIVVLTEDVDIARISELYGVTPFRGSSGEEEASFESQILEAMIQREKAAFDEYDIILIVQPNAPLLSVNSLNVIIEKFDNPNIDSIISVKEDRHLRWGFDAENKRFFPIYSNRDDVNRLPPQYIETGTILATRRHFVNGESVLGLNIDLVELSKKESIVVDTFEDLWLAEKYYNKKRVVIVVNAFDEIGLNHIRRSLAIASKLVVHDVIFVSNVNYPMGIEAIKENNYPIVTYDDSDEIFDVIDKLNPDFVINDILDTKSEYISKLRESGYFVINFEDLGPGVEYANLVFNSLSDYGLDLPNVYTGHEYYILDDEFYFQPTKEIKENVNRVLIMFLGNDPHNLTEKAMQAILSSGYSGSVDVLLGVGYPNKKEFEEKYEIFNNVAIYEDVRSMSELIHKADIVITSAGRAMYEICHIGVPCIVICEDNRQLTNSFANDKNGFINMGLADDVTLEDIRDKFSYLEDNFELRTSMNKKMLDVDLKNGFNNILSVVKENSDDFDF
ncbi:MAG: glycosyltransferase [Methanobrevibacter sp.]|uniref:cytidylyltransferase domain-containing protein n=1 Tax=Methanobrevibacter sp. TaxID=66852 RepID=UPI0026DEB863|nr:glycosyltransferase [Methanobrevibacter sp.]MDO5848213.1 glycosyltransferase [Methanobrevibacter sp.]